MSEQKTIIDPSLQGFLLQLQEAVQYGWELDMNNHPPAMWGVAYETGLIRDDKTVAAWTARTPGSEPRMTRGETLALAREAKATKRAQGASDGL